MRAARVDHEDSVGSFVNPDAILLLPFGVDTKRVIGGEAYGKLAGRLKNGARQEEPEKH